MKNENVVFLVTHTHTHKLCIHVPLTLPPSGHSTAELKSFIIPAYDVLVSTIKWEKCVSPFSEQFEGHEREHKDAEHEEQEDVEDLRQSIPDASERSAKLNTNRQTH